MKRIELLPVGVLFLGILAATNDLDKVSAAENSAVITENVSGVTIAVVATNNNSSDDCDDTWGWRGGQCQSGWGGCQPDPDVDPDTATYGCGYRPPLADDGSGNPGDIMDQCCTMYYDTAGSAATGERKAFYAKATGDILFPGCGLRRDVNELKSAPQQEIIRLRGRRGGKSLIATGTIESFLKLGLVDGVVIGRKNPNAKIAALGHQPGDFVPIATGIPIETRLASTINNH